MESSDIYREVVETNDLTSELEQSSSAWRFVEDVQGYFNVFRFKVRTMNETDGIHILLIRHQAVELRNTRRHAPELDLSTPCTTFTPFDFVGNEVRTQMKQNSITQERRSVFRYKFASRGSTLFNNIVNNSPELYQMLTMYDPNIHYLVMIMDGDCRMVKMYYTQTGNVVCEA